jgi:hypothetical protein
LVPCPKGRSAFTTLYCTTFPYSHPLKILLPNHMGGFVIAAGKFKEIKKLSARF